MHPRQRLGKYGDEDVYDPRKRATKSMPCLAPSFRIDRHLLPSRDRWERAANLFVVSVSQIQAWISAGQLRVLDTFVTDRSFEDFQRCHSR